MRYAQLRSFDISNGEGIGVALFVQGCHFHCKDCFNQDTWDFNGGKPFEPEIEMALYAHIDKPYVKRVSFLGGEPLCDENVLDVYEIIEKIKIDYPTKKIWVYTGYEFETLLLNYVCPHNDYELYRGLIAKLADYIIDGKFQTDKKDLNLLYRGSSNQRIIDVNNSLKNGRIILYREQ